MPEKPAPHTPPDGPRLLLSAMPVVVAGGKSLALAAMDGLLLAWLCVEGATPRDRLSELLWPGNTPAAGRNALRQRLFRLRRLLGIDLVSGTATLTLAAGLTHDLSADSSLLEGLPNLADGELQAWLAAQRLQRRRARMQAMEVRMDGLEAAGETTAALALARELVDADPLSEALHRRVMRLHYLRGDRAAAMLAFDTCEAILKHEVGTRPSAETLALLATVQSGDAGPARALGHRLPAALLRPPRLIGRDDELRRLREEWMPGTVAVVLGEAGIGKTRLLQALLADDGAVLGTAARPGDDLVPLATLARLLQSLVERLGSGVDERLRIRLGPLLPMSGAIVPTRPRDGTLVEPLRTLLHLAPPWVGGLVLDDVQFADTASLELLQAVLTAPGGIHAPVRWCLGMRPPVAHSPARLLLDSLDSSGPCVRLNLPPFSEGHVAELVDSLQLPGATGAHWARVLRRRSGGNPLFALETLKLAWSQGLMDAGAPASALPRSASLLALIEQQLARLSPAATLLARLAAIAGADFDVSLAERVLKQDALQLADAWHELESAHVLVGNGFAHDLVFEAVLARVPVIIARHLHGQIARCLESEAGAPARVAAHWESAGDPARALPHLRAAAQHAHLALREHERIDLLLRAADIAEQHGDAAIAFASIADAVKSHMNTIRHVGGYALLDRLDRLVRSPAQKAEALGYRAWYCTQLADGDAALRHGQAALALATTLDDPMPALVIRHRLATAIAATGRFEEAIIHFQVVQACLERTPGSSMLRDEDQSEFHGNFAAVLDNLGHRDGAATQRRLAMAAAQRAGDAAQQVSQLANQAVSQITGGDVMSAAASIEQAERLISSYDMSGSTVGFVAVLRCQTARALGHYQRALLAADEAERQLSVSNPARLPAVRLHRAHCWLDLGQFARALHELSAAEGLPPHQEARRCLLMSRLKPRERSRWLEAAATMVPRQGWPEVQLLVRLEQTRLLDDAAAVKRLTDLRTEADTALLHGVRRAVDAQLFARLADTTGSTGRPAAAEQLDAALRLLAVQLPEDDTCAALCCAAELPWHAARLMHAAGMVDEARNLRQRLAAWVHEMASEQVKPAFRDSFLQRNQMHQAMLTDPPRWR